MLAHAPSAPALDDNGRVVVELRLARLRSQLAVVRAVADQVEYLSRTAGAEGLGEQLIEEMTRLGYRLLEAAGTRAGTPRPEDSGVFLSRG
jgi:L-amino acid N-acyltransferase YncA